MIDAAKNLLADFNSKTNDNIRERICAISSVSEAKEKIEQTDGSREDRALVGIKRIEDLFDFPDEILIDGRTQSDDKCLGIFTDVINPKDYTTVEQQLRNMSIEKAPAGTYYHNYHKLNDGELSLTENKQYSLYCVIQMLLILLGITSSYDFDVEISVENMDKTKIWLKNNYQKIVNLTGIRRSGARDIDKKLYGGIKTLIQKWSGSGLEIIHIYDRIYGKTIRKISHYKLTCGVKMYEFKNYLQYLKIPKLCKYNLSKQTIDINETLTLDQLLKLNL